MQVGWIGPYFEVDEADWRGAMKPRQVLSQARGTPKQPTLTAIGRGRKTAHRCVSLLVV